MVDPLRLAIAATPLAAYLLLLALVNVRRRPLLATGAGDAAALGGGLVGLAFIGPIELFRPESATAEMGPWVWVVLIVLYALIVSLAVLLARPRLVIYNIGLDELRPALAEAVGQLDREARWAGDNLTLPSLGVSLHVEAFEFMRHVSLKSSGDRQNLEGWRRLARALRRSLASVSVQPSPRWPSFAITAAVLTVLTLIALQRHPQRVAEAVAHLTHF
ncbi:hypothetical protein Pla175_44980 [Pirellulimonas nuda]|uniref:Uncharacterized protein n=1 Tax=Pirellulimonas nuda TaxID=2528009 RepID=A0A518DHX1_9BACT|nr:hypothetical protein [Pirellulimonas nuda]QDU91080.1 hypothetical protein Pla175_44980 [Pirellulimonas nuda]